MADIDGRLPNVTEWWTHGYWATLLTSFIAGLVSWTTLRDSYMKSRFYNHHLLVKKMKNR